MYVFAMIPVAVHELHLRNTAYKQQILPNCMEVLFM